MISPIKIWRNQKKVIKLLNLKGEIISWTKIYVPPSGFEGQAPYMVVIAGLENGRRYTAQLVDWEERHLVLVFLRAGNIFFGGNTGCLMGNPAFWGIKKKKIF